MKTVRHSAIVVLLLVFGLGPIACSPPQPTPEEQHLLRVLTDIATIAKNPGNGELLAQQLAEIKPQVDALKSVKKASPCFAAAVRRCHSAYILAGRAWENRIAAIDPNRIADLELAYNFSLSFATLSLEKARDCYSSP